MRLTRVHHAAPFALLLISIVAVWGGASWLEIEGVLLPRAVLLGAVAAWFVFGTVLRLRAWRVLDTPTTKIAAATVGTCEMTGTVMSHAPTPSPATSTPCAWFSWELQEHRKRGKSRRWVTVEEREHRAPFTLEDDTGRVVVQPAHAEFHGIEERTYPVPGRNRRWRQLERLVPDRTRAYVLGPVRPNGDTLEVGCDDKGEEFLVSDDSERRIAFRLGAWAWVALLLGAAGLVPAFLLTVVVDETVGGERDVRFDTTDDTGLLVAAAVVYLLLLLGSWLLRAYNRLVIVRNQAEKAWASIEVQLQRRDDLIPSLVEVTKAYAVHERGALTATTELRAGARLPDDAAVHAATVHDRDASRGAHDLLALAEQYPDLAADEQFRRLAGTVTDAENRIALARSFYNDAVNVMRDRRSTFPYLLVAPLVAMPSLELFGASEEARPASTLPPWPAART